MQNLISKPVVDQLNEATKRGIARVIDAGHDPQLAVVLVGDDPSSLKYITKKSESAKQLGIIVSLYHMEADTPFDRVQETLHFLSEDEEIDGIVLQLPLPSQFSEDQVDRLIGSIAPLKDVDGLRGDWQKMALPEPNIASFMGPMPLSLPPMVGSVVSLLDHYGIDMRGQQIVLIGSGRLVGRPLHAYFASKGMSVSAVDEETPDILHITKSADILVSGTGQSSLVTYQWIKEGAVVIDCAADVHADSVSQVASALSPSVGGIGPLTIAWLLHNVMRSAESRFASHAD